MPPPPPKTHPHVSATFIRKSLTLLTLRQAVNKGWGRPAGATSTDLLTICLGLGCCFWKRWVKNSRRRDEAGVHLSVRSSLTLGTGCMEGGGWNRTLGLRGDPCTRRSSKVTSFVVISHLARSALTDACRSPWPFPSSRKGASSLERVLQARRWHACYLLLFFFFFPSTSTGRWKCHRIKSLTPSPQKTQVWRIASPPTKRYLRPFFQYATDSPLSIFGSSEDGRGSDSVVCEEGGGGWWWCCARYGPLDEGHFARSREPAGKNTVAHGGSPGSWKATGKKLWIIFERKIHFLWRLSGH